MSFAPTTPPAQLNDDEIARYARHLSLPQWSETQQLALRHSRVICIGAGGLGCPVLLYLAAAGVGHINIVDPDTVCLSNLQRQVLFTEADIGHSKAQRAAQHLRARNAQCQVEAQSLAINANNALALLKAYDVVIDCSDNFATRYVLNDACCTLNKPLVAASILGFCGQVSVFAGDAGPCYRCLFPSPPEHAPSCTEAGVLGVLPGLLGTVQATEVLKLLTHIGENLQGRVLQYDARNMTVKTYQLSVDPNCLACQQRLAFSDLPRPSLPATCVAEDEGEAPALISVQTLHQWFEDKRSFLLLDVREPHEYALCNLGGVLLPLAQLPGQIHTLPRKQCIAVLCRSGQRSQQATHFLRAQGLTDVYNVAGGILAWSKQIDPRIPQY